MNNTALSRLFATMLALGLAACGGGGSAPSGSSAPAPAAPAPAPAPGAMTFASRCAQAGVVKCIGFDNIADFNVGSGGTAGAYGQNAGILAPYGTSDYSRATRDIAVKASGNSSLRFTIPSNSGADTSGAFFTNFSQDLSVQFDGNQEFYVQWRQRFSPEFIGTRYEGGGGFKQIIIGTGDQPSTLYSSCTSLEVVASNYLQNGLPILYNSCSGSTSHGPYDGFYEPLGAYDFKLQNRRDGAGCLYSQKNSSYFAPAGNCFGYVANEWMTFQIHVKLGPRVGDEFKDSLVEMWMAREGQASELVEQWGPYHLSAGDPAENQRFGKVWLVPYNTGKSAAMAHATAYTWYDELIISRTRIADPTP